jgi:heme exporter protein B
VRCSRLFAVLVVVLFALALGREPSAAGRHRGAVLWWPCCWPACWRWTTCSVPTPRMALEQWRLAPVPLAWLVLVRVLLHWLANACRCWCQPLLGRNAASAA